MRKPSQPRSISRGNLNADKAMAINSTTVTKPGELVALLLDELDSRQPRIPLDKDSCLAIADFRTAIAAGAAPEQMACFLWDGLDKVLWSSMDDPDVPRHGLSLIRLVHLVAVGMAGLKPLGIRGVPKPERIPLARLIDMMFEVEPRLNKILRIKDDPKRDITVKTRKQCTLQDRRVRVDFKLLNAMPSDEIFDLSVPYNKYFTDLDWAEI